MSGRDRYFDFLRALALIRVVLHHSFMSVVALQLAFPAMGVMFALGGSLMARSVDRDAGRAVRNRLRRLLPAVWLMGLILVPLMFYRGWPDRPGWSSLLLWAVPVGLPPASEFGEHLGAGVLWYIYTYVWLVLLSPWLLRLYRLWNLPAVLLPFVCLLLLFGYQGIFSVEVFWVLQNIFTYGTFWVLGIAHREVISPGCARRSCSAWRWPASPARRPGRGGIRSTASSPRTRCRSRGRSTCSGSCSCCSAGRRRWGGWTGSGRSAGSSRWSTTGR
ncbi:acyltransferase family protein [Paractinoplanes durhamensis]|uniref:acyltransferase family protein n=1 Tax=Paractinoplanes durhamensis TaxID=113563 RepID=UPI00362E27A1